MDPETSQSIYTIFLEPQWLSLHHRRIDQIHSQSILHPSKQNSFNPPASSSRLMPSWKHTPEFWGWRKQVADEIQRAVTYSPIFINNICGRRISFQMFAHLLPILSQHQAIGDEILKCWLIKQCCCQYHQCIDPANSPPCFVSAPDYNPYSAYIPMPKLSSFIWVHQPFQMRKQKHKRILPPTGLIKTLCNKMTRKVPLKQLLILKRVVNVAVWHWSTLKSAIKHLQSKHSWAWISTIITINPLPPSLPSLCQPLYHSV